MWSFYTLIRPVVGAQCMNCKMLSQKKSTHELQNVVAKKIHSYFMKRAVCLSQPNLCQLVGASHWYCMVNISLHVLIPIFHDSCPDIFISSILSILFNFFCSQRLSQCYKGLLRIVSKILTKNITKLPIRTRACFAHTQTLSC